MRADDRLREARRAKRLHAGNFEIVKRSVIPAAKISRRSSTRYSERTRIARRKAPEASAPARNRRRAGVAMGGFFERGSIEIDCSHGWLSDQDADDPSDRGCAQGIDGRANHFEDQWTIVRERFDGARAEARSSGIWKKRTSEMRRRSRSTGSRVTAICVDRPSPDVWKNGGRRVFNLAQQVRRSSRGDPRKVAESPIPGSLSSTKNFHAQPDASELRHSGLLASSYVRRSMALRRAGRRASLRIRLSETECRRRDIR